MSQSPVDAPTRARPLAHVRGRALVLTLAAMLLLPLGAQADAELKQETGYPDLQGTHFTSRLLLEDGWYPGPSAPIGVYLPGDDSFSGRTEFVTGDTVHYFANHALRPVFAWIKLENEHTEPGGEIVFIGNPRRSFPEVIPLDEDQSENAQALWIDVHPAFQSSLPRH